MTSDLELISLFQTIRTNLYRYGGIFLICIGTVSCLLNLIVFNKKNLRKNPCSMYFVAENIINLLLIYTSLLLSVLSNGFDINLAARSIHACRFNVYTVFVWDILGPFYLILASIDRVLVTSRNARTRQRSTHRLAGFCIIGGTLLWALLHVHALIFSDIIELAPGYVFCYFKSKTYLQVSSFYSLIVKAILVPIVMGALGAWAIRNVRRMGRTRVGPEVSVSRTDGGGGHVVHSKDRQLVRILLINISVYMICNLMLTSVLMYQSITQYRPKTVLDTSTDLFLLIVSVFCSNAFHCCGCYVNLLVSKTFRKEVKNVLLCR